MFEELSQPSNYAV